MDPQPSTDELLDDYSLEQAITELPSESDLSIDGIPLEEMTEMVTEHSDSSQETEKD